MIIGKTTSKKIFSGVSVAVATILTSTFCFNAQAANLSCSSEEAKFLVIEQDQQIMKENQMVSDTVDLEQSTFHLEEIRTEGNDGFKLECTGRLMAHITIKEKRPANDPAAAAFVHALMDKILSGNDIRYTVQNTDDGKLYVKLMR